MDDAAALAVELGLAPHPEGGWYRRTWEHPATDDGGRRLASSILYLLGAGGPTRWHRIDAAEMWVHTRGSPLELETSDGAGRDVVTLGSDHGDGRVAQAVVPPGRWQRARVAAGWSLVICVVVPEFRFGSFELAPAGWEP